MWKACLALFFAAALCGGCASILEGEETIVTEHTVLTRPEITARSVEASDFEELRAAVLGFVSSHDDMGAISVYGYDGDIDEDLARACREVSEDTPIGAFAVSDMAWSVSKIVSYYEVEINIAYRRTRSQLDGMVMASSQRFLRSELLNIMSRYSETAVIYTRLGDITEDDIRGYIEEIYYENPLEIIMLPVVGVEIFPESGNERIVEITLGQRNPPGISLTYTAGLVRAARNIAEAASGESDGEILLDLLERLTDASEYDADAARIGQYSTQNFNATAYGALVYGAAIGEGYAMAYKALCDELGLECTVALGERGSYMHAWNIVRVNDDYYHIDASMCDVNGAGTAFLRNDAEMAQDGYIWAAGRYPACSGPLKYADFASAEDGEPESEAEAEAGGEPVGEGEAGGEPVGEGAQEVTPPSLP
ncbi:MAG: hypothetical protein LBC21_00445 [Oscillospiraceae bacterium]|nr:hypothetical protein [Oscillospiraceae bacterium]